MSGAELLRMVLGILALFLSLTIVVLSLTWLERKSLGRIQMRMGPMRVGPYGLLQAVADAVKLVAKEDIMPGWVNRPLYWFAPLAVFIPSFLVWVTIPVARDVVVRNMDMGLFYIIAFSVLSIVGLVTAGWSSANKYAIMGGFRAAGQLVSYEIPIILAVLGVAILAQSMNLVAVVEKQAAAPYVLLQPLGMLLFLLAGLAEVGRTPFDIHPAESEVVGGPFIEYSGAHWAVFFLAEYINTFAVAALMVLLFLGGWLSPGLPGDVAGVGVVVFGVKTYLMVMAIFWLRGTFPRLRIDQLMSLGWKLLVPLSFVNIVVTAVYLFYGWPSWSLTLMSVALIAVTFWGIGVRMKTTPRPENTVRLYVPTAEAHHAG